MAFINKFCSHMSDTDYVVSPLSVETVLSMLFQGASGKTEKEIKRVLNGSTREAVAEEFKPLIDDLNTLKGITLNFANKMFIEQSFGLKSDFQNVLEDKFRSRVDTADLTDGEKSATDINQWVENMTNGKIKDLFAPNDFEDCVLVLVNALYFKGFWEIPFNEKYTSKGTFHVSKTETIECDMMFIFKNLYNAYSKKLNATLLELAYEGGEGSMIIILPSRGQDIDKMEKKLSTVDLSTLKETEHFYNNPVELILPKFKLEYKLDVKDTLQKMGLHKMFDQSSAEFSNIADTIQRLFVGVFRQKACIEVNEQGTEGAVATGSMVMFCSGPSQMSVNRPFMFIVQTRSANRNNVLFVGKVTRPTY